MEKRTHRVKNPIKISVKTYAIKEDAHLQLPRDLFLISYSISHVPWYFFVLFCKCHKQNAAWYLVQILQKSVSLVSTIVYIKQISNFLRNIVSSMLCIFLISSD